MTHSLRTDEKDADARARAVACFSAGRPLLLAWFKRSARSLPWRPPHSLSVPAKGDSLLPVAGFKTSGAQRSPYAVWISEVMLQQTQVATVIPYFERWMEIFPDPAALARAPEETVLRAWAGLGYYARARNLHRAAVALTASGAYPGSAEAWKTLSGVGDYTAGAIASLAFGQKAPILDGNVVRVFSRLLGLDFLPGDNAVAKKDYWDLAALWADHPRPGEVNEGLMELGALICVPASPRCDQCPVAAMCTARREGRQNVLPLVKKREKVEAVRAVAVRARDAQGRVLTELRGPGAFLAGHELFPLFLGAEAADWRAAFARRFPESRLVNTRAGDRIRHSIMSKRYDVEIWDGEVSAPGRAWDTARWTRGSEVAQRLTNSLAKKIWGTGKKGT